MHSLTPKIPRILIVDDNRGIHDDFRKILAPDSQSAGELEAAESMLFGAPAETKNAMQFELHSAYQGKEALELVRQSLADKKPYAMAFMDVRMPPGWDGIETTSEIWKLDPDIQIVICTAYSDYSWNDLHEKLGHTDRLVILKKPFDNIEVLQLAHAVSEKWRLLQQTRAHVFELETRVDERTAALRESQEMVLRQERLAAVGQLSAGVAHDFNNIMTVIQGYAELITIARGCSPEWEHALAEITSASKRAAKLTQQLLAFSRKQVMQCRYVDLAEVVNDFRTMLSRALSERISIQIDSTPDGPTIYADTALVEQVLMNLAVNARDAMSQGGELKIGVKSVQTTAARALEFPEAVAGNFVCLSVSDTGSGMDAATLKKIFEPFFTTKEVGKGTGLGLSTVYGIVKQHQGWIEAESTVGQGSTFRVYFPEAAVAAELDVAEETALGDARGNGEVILVVEDEPSVRSLVKNICVRSGYSVIEAASGDEAIEMFREAGPRVDLMLTDLVMPGNTSGKELADRLRAQNPDLKVIFTSGYSREAQRDFLREGVNFLHKPYQPPRLRDMIRRTINGKNGYVNLGREESDEQAA